MPTRAHQLLAIAVSLVPGVSRRAAEHRVTTLCNHAARSCGHAHRYADDASPVLKGLNLEFKGGEKVGVVGRTGAGKSSMITALFRLTEIDSVGKEAGKIRIDGVDVASIGLSKLRAAISTIPQDPVLMKGTIRYNLDPFDNRSDAEVRRALSSASIEADRINEAIEAGGSNISVGERQLLCFARTLAHLARQSPSMACLQHAVSTVYVLPHILGNGGGCSGHRALGISPSWGGLAACVLV